MISEETEESSKVTAPEGDMFDPEEYPFDIKVNNLKLPV